MEIQSCCTYLTTLERRTVEVERDGSAAVAGVLHAVEAQFVTHVRHVVRLGVIDLLLHHGMVLVQLLLGPEVPGLRSDRRCLRRNTNNA